MLNRRRHRVIALRCKRLVDWSVTQREHPRPKQSLRRRRGGKPADGMQKAMLAIAVLACIAQPAASATRSDTTGAEAIILYERGDLDFIAYFLGLAEGMAWSNSYLQFKKAPLIFCGPSGFSSRQLFDILTGFVTKHPKVGELKIGNALMVSLQDAYPCP